MSICSLSAFRSSWDKGKSLVVITDLVNKYGGSVKINTMAKLSRVLHYLWVPVTNKGCPSVFLNPCCQGSVRLPIIHKIAVGTPNLWTTHLDCKADGLSLALGKCAHKVSRGLKPTLILLLVNTLETLSETPLIYGRTTKLHFVAVVEASFLLIMRRGALR